MSALPAAAATIGTGFFASLGQLAGNWLALIPLAVAVIIVACLRRRSRTVPLLALPPAAVLCPCCTGRPMEFDDCTCREPCGETWCQAIDPDEPMFYEHGHIVGRDGREAVLRRAREQDQAEADDFEREIDEMTPEVPAVIIDLDTGSCPRGCPDGECYCSEPSYNDPAYTRICPGCGGYEECYCGEE